jgi:hypothetical protein
MRLIASLQSGDGNCDTLLTDCLAELEGTAWAARLRQSSLHIQNFDYAAAGRMLGKG